MFTRKPLFLLETESETEGTESDAPEAEETSATQPEPEGDEPSSDGDEPETFDAARALAKIKKANSEARTQRERAKAAEEKAQGLEPAKRDAALQRVARRLNLPDTEEVDSFLARLQGDTVDDLAEDAERLLSLLAPKDTKSTTRRPKEALRGGGDPEDGVAVGGVLRYSTTSGCCPAFCISSKVSRLLLQRGLWYILIMI